MKRDGCQSIHPYIGELKKRLEYLRYQIKNECISYGEIAELQSFVKYIKEDDIILLEWTGVKERII